MSSSSKKTMSSLLRHVLRHTHPRNYLNNYEIVYKDSLSHELFCILVNALPENIPDIERILKRLDLTRERTDLINEIVSKLRSGSHIPDDLLMTTLYSLGEYKNTIEVTDNVVNGTSNHVGEHMPVEEAIELLEGNSEEDVNDVVMRYQHLSLYTGLYEIYHGNYVDKPQLFKLAIERSDLPSYVKRTTIINLDRSVAGDFTTPMDEVLLKTLSLPLNGIGPSPRIHKLVCEERANTKYEWWRMRELALEIEKSYKILQRISYDATNSAVYITLINIVYYTSALRHVTNTFRSTEDGSVLRPECLYELELILLQGDLKLIRDTDIDLDKGFLDSSAQYIKHIDPSEKYLDSEFDYRCHW